MRHAPRHAMAVLSSDQEAAVRTQFAPGAQPAEAKPTGKYPPTEIAAYAAVCNLLLNLDEVLTKE